MKTGKVRVRFAPSPTGLMHLGGIRSALFNWLYGQKTGGKFILRFEDTDRERLVPEAIEQIKQSLLWLGLEWQEGVDRSGDYGPYTQSERLPIYQEHARMLIEKGSLYPCWCSTERLDRLRKEAQTKQTAFRYDRYCLAHPKTPAEPHVLRFKVPAGQTVAWDDAVRGRLEFISDQLDDFVAVKSDNYPTYHFASIVDDHLMQISHVLRGDEWVPSTPKHLLLYQAFGWTPPLFVHLPPVLGADKAKLSKRHGARSVLEYRDQGYLPDAVINFLAALGWNEGEGSTKEIYNREELIQAFALERIQKSPAVFNPERLDWINGVYIRSLDLDRLAAAARDYWPPEAGEAEVDYLTQILTLVQERLKFLAELPELTAFFFTDPDPSNIKTVSVSGANLRTAIEIIEQSNFKQTDLEPALRALAAEQKLKTGELFMALRVAITGQTATPPLFDVMTVLGKKRVLDRLKKALAAL